MEILNKKRTLIKEIDGFWDTISRSGLVFKAGINDYFNNRLDRLKKRLSDIDELESEADTLRRDIKYKVYSQMLIPDSRGDVLGLLESSDNVIDRTKKVLHSFEIEKPEIPQYLAEDFNELAAQSALAIDEMVKAARCFFTGSRLIEDYINKAYHYEHEADKLEEQIKRKAFEPNCIDRLSLKVQIRYFAEKISLIADLAEAVCERLTIYNIKRMV